MNRNYSKALRDRARNIKTKALKTGETLPEYFGSTPVRISFFLRFCLFRSADAAWKLLRLDRSSRFKPFLTCSLLDRIKFGTSLHFPHHQLTTLAINQARAASAKTSMAPPPRGGNSTSIADPKRGDPSNDEDEEVEDDEEEEEEEEEDEEEEDEEEEEGEEEDGDE